MAFMGMTPFGSLIYGGLASLLGAPETLIIGGSVCILGGLMFTYRLPIFKKLIRPVYKEKGIIREIAEGIGTAVNLRTPPQN
jgi:hypothetical protein